MGRVADEYDLILHKLCILDGRIAGITLDDAQVDLLVLQRLFYLLGIAGSKTDLYLGVAAMKIRQDGRDDIRRCRHAAAQEQSPAKPLCKAAHVEFEIPVYGKQLFGMLQQPFARRRQADARAVPFKEFYLEVLLQLVDMPGHRWLRDKKLFGRPGEVETLGYGVKYLQTKVKCHARLFIK